MNFIQALRAFYDKRFDYHSRSRRSEYWWFQLAYGLITVLAMSIDTTLLGNSAYSNFTPVVMAVELLFLIPLTCLTARRLHDVGLTGWAQLPSFLFYISYLPGFESFPFETGNGGALGGVLIIVFVIYMFWLLFNLIKDSQSGHNRYGPNPKEDDLMNVFD